MPKITAGILLYRFRDGGLEVFLAHPGGPYWRKKDQGAWTLPKGEIENGEDPLEAARREFGEETGHHPPGPFEALGKARLRSGKLILAWACEGDLDPQALVSNEFEVEWPPRSGRRMRFPEIDRGDFFRPEEGRDKLHPAQLPFLDELERILRESGRLPPPGR